MEGSEDPRRLKMHPTDLEMGVALAMLCALMTNLGFLLRHRGAQQSPAVDIRHPLRSATSLFRTPVFALGFAVAVVGVALHIAALWFAPISIVQAVISGGIVLLAVVAEQIFGLRLGRRQWAGVLLTAFGLMLLALTVRRGGGHSFSMTALAGFEAGALLIGVLLLAGHRFGAPSRHHGLLLASASGMLIGVSDIAIKAMTNVAADEGAAAAFLSLWFVVAVSMAIVSFFSVARAFQIGDAVPAITMIGVASALLQIAGGIVVFNDPLPSGELGVLAQVAGFALICLAAALVPAPTRVVGPRAA